MDPWKITIPVMKFSQTYKFQWLVDIGYVGLMNTDRFQLSLVPIWERCSTYCVRLLKLGWIWHLWEWIVKPASLKLLADLDLMLFPFHRWSWCFHIWVKFVLVPYLQISRCYATTFVNHIDWWTVKHQRTLCAQGGTFWTLARIYLFQEP